MSNCYCNSTPTFDPDYEFEDETGFVCAKCDANVYYEEEA